MILCKYNNNEHMFKINYYFCETNSWIGLFFDSIIREITNKNIDMETTQVYGMPRIGDAAPEFKAVTT